MATTIYEAKLEPTEFGAMINEGYKINPDDANGGLCEIFYDVLDEIRQGKAIFNKTENETRIYSSEKMSGIWIKITKDGTISVGYPPEI